MTTSWSYDERARLTASSAALANSAIVGINIEDNDVAPGRVMLTIAPTEADESDGTVSIQVNAELDGGTTLHQGHRDKPQPPADGTADRGGGLRDHPPPP